MFDGSSRTGGASATNTSGWSSRLSATELNTSSAGAPSISSTIEPRVLVIAFSGISKRHAAEARTSGDVMPLNTKPPATPVLTVPSGATVTIGASPTVPAPSTRVRRRSPSGSRTCGARPLGRANTSAVRLRPGLSLTHGWPTTTGYPVPRRCHRSR